MLEEDVVILHLPSELSETCFGLGLVVRCNTKAIMLGLASECQDISDYLRHFVRDCKALLAYGMALCTFLQILNNFMTNSPLKFLSAKHSAKYLSRN